MSSLSACQRQRGSLPLSSFGWLLLLQVLVLGATTRELSVDTYALKPLLTLCVEQDAPLQGFQSIEGWRAVAEGSDPSSVLLFSPNGNICYRIEAVSWQSFHNRLPLFPGQIKCRLGPSYGVFSSKRNTLRVARSDLVKGKIVGVVSRESGSANVRESLRVPLVLIIVILGVCFFIIFVSRQSRCRPGELPEYLIPAVPPGEGKLQECRMGQKIEGELGTWGEERRANGRKQLLTVDIELAHVVIGQGGFGVVEKGVMGGREVAVKFLNCKASSNTNAESTLLNEVQVMEQVPPNDNVVKYFGICKDESQRLGIVEELLDRNLSDWMRKDNFREQITVKEVLGVFIGVTKGLEHLHRFKVVHYDLKPQNILLDTHLNPKLADFGCSKFKASSYITAGLYGTVGYLAPECVFSLYSGLKQRVCAEKIDIYSLGVVMWELIFGKGPPHSNSLMLLSLRSSHQCSSCSSDQTSGNLAETCDNTYGAAFDINDLSLSFQMPNSCPEDLRSLLVDCTNFKNGARPTCSMVRNRLEAMQEAPWARQTLRHALGQ